MAIAWPEAQVIATDLTPPDPTTLPSPLPPNLNFIKSDADDESWPFEHKFDFIHGRMLASGIHDWPGLLSRCWNHLEPGGHLELLDLCHPFRAQDPDFDTPESSAFIKWGHAAETSWKAQGLDYRSTTKHAQRLSDLGFEKIQETQLKWPLGEWTGTTEQKEDEKREKDKEEQTDLDADRNRQIGALTLHNFSAFLTSAGPKILSHHPTLNAAEAEQLTQEALSDLHDNCCTKRFYLTM